MHGGVRADLGLPVSRRDGLVTGLGALEHALGHGEGRHHLDPALVGLGPLEVILEEELLLLGDRRGRDGGELGRGGRGLGGVGGAETGDQEEGEPGTHGRSLCLGRK